MHQMFDAFFLARHVCSISAMSSLTSRHVRDFTCMLLEHYSVKLGCHQQLSSLVPCPQMACTIRFLSQC